MKTLKVTSVLLSLFLCLFCQAQRNDVLFINGQVIDNDLYENVEGSPYYFDKWQQGKIYPKDEKEPIEEAWLNYNGYTKNFEVKKGKQFIMLDEHWYKRVEIPRDDRNNIVFEIDLLPKRTKQFAEVIYKGSDWYILKDFHVSLIKTKKVRYAGNIEVQNFVKKPTYYFVENGKINVLKLKKKNILALFTGHKSAMEEYVNHNRLKLSKAKDLVRLMDYYDELTRPTIFENTGEKQ